MTSSESGILLYRRILSFELVIVFTIKYRWHSTILFMISGWFEQFVRQTCNIKQRQSFIFELDQFLGLSIYPSLLIMINRNIYNLCWLRGNVNFNTWLILQNKVVTVMIKVHIESFVYIYIRLSWKKLSV